MDQIEIWTDGATIDNGSLNARGGWACKLVWNGGWSVCHSGSIVGETTNNRAEIIAAIMGLRYVQNKNVPVIVYSDSQYVVNIANGNWQKKSNDDLWDILFAEKRRFRDIRFEWIKGHAGNLNNEECDALAEAEARRCSPWM